MDRADLHFYTSLLAEHPYATGGVLAAGGLFGIYRIAVLGCRLGYGYLITREDPDRAAEIIDATLRPGSKRRPPPKGS